MKKRSRKERNMNMAQQWDFNVDDPLGFDSVVPLQAYACLGLGWACPGSSRAEIECVWSMSRV